MLRWLRTRLIERFERRRDRDAVREPAAAPVTRFRISMFLTDDACDEADEIEFTAIAETYVAAFAIACSRAAASRGATRPDEAVRVVTEMILNGKVDVDVERLARADSFEELRLQ